MGELARARYPTGEGRGRRVLVLEDYEIAARTLHRLLTEVGYDVVAVFRSLAGLHRWVATAAGDDVAPDLVITDLQLTDTSWKGEEVVASLGRLRAERWPQLRILVHTRTTAPAVLAAAFAAGADGFVAKGDEDDILARVRGSLDGETSVSPTVASYLLRGLRDLTPMQCKVLEELAEGATNDQIRENCGNLSKNVLDGYLAELRVVAGIEAPSKPALRAALIGFARGESW